MATIGNTLRLAVAGDDEISFYKEGQEQYPVKIRVLESQRGDIGEIGRLTVPSPSGPVRIDNIAQLQRGLGPTTLQRSDRQFAVMFISDVAPGHALDEATNDVRKMLVGLNMPPTMSFKFQGQSKILDETTANMIMAIGLAMIFVYMAALITSPGCSDNSSKPARRPAGAFSTSSPFTIIRKAASSATTCRRRCNCGGIARPVRCGIRLTSMKRGSTIAYNLFDG